MVSHSRENRKTKRRHLIYYLRVFNLQTQEQLGHLVDITADGLMIVGEMAITVDTDYHLHMVLPSEIMGRGTLDFDARAVWTRKDVDPNFFCTGFRINGAAEEHLKIFRRLIKDFGFQD